MTPAIEQAVPQLRAFNRDFSRLMGLLEPRYMGGDLTLVEARVVYEIRERQPVLARDIAHVLDLDPGYLSRIVAALVRRGWVKRGTGKDARQRPLSLTTIGRREFETLDQVTAAKTASMLGELDQDSAIRLQSVLSQAGDLLFENTERDWSMRTFRPGDMGMVSARQAIIYSEGYGWGDKLEALILEIAANFLRDFKPGREQCWIAERGSRMLGSVFLVEEDERTARLRLLYVEAEARGLGIGAALVRQCSEFARQAGYERIVLWTHAVLHSARNIYAQEGYKVIETEVQNEFGKEETSEHWLLEL